MLQASRSRPPSSVGHSLPTLASWVRTYRTTLGPQACHLGVIPSPFTRRGGCAPWSAGPRVGSDLVFLAHSDSEDSFLRCGAQSCAHCPGVVPRNGKHWVYCI